MMPLISLVVTGDFIECTGDCLEVKFSYKGGKQQIQSLDGRKALRK